VDKPAVAVNGSAEPASAGFQAGSRGLQPDGGLSPPRIRA